MSNFQYLGEFYRESCYQGDLRSYLRMYKMKWIQALYNCLSVVLVHAMLFSESFMPKMFSGNLKDRQNRGFPAFPQSGVGSGRNAFVRVLPRPHTTEAFFAREGRIGIVL